MTLLERAARAVEDQFDDKFVELLDPDGPLSSYGLSRAIARAVLTAIREPSEGMLVAGVTAPNYLEDQSSRRGCGNIYSAMIDAALAEK